MRDFDYDVMQKKILARQAKYKKNGSKSKKCSLPSDRLTAAQIRKLSGEVHSMNTNKPMTWDDFRALPKTMAQEYIDTLQEKYDARGANFAAMFGVARGIFERYCEKEGLLYAKKRGHQKATDAAAWAEFLGVPEEVAEPEVEKAVAEKPEESYWPIDPIRLTVEATGELFFLAEYIKTLPLRGEYHMTVTMSRQDEAEA